jgi:threonine dehydratase
MVLVSDDEMRTAARWLWFEMGVGAELSGAAAIAAIQAGKVDLPKDSTVAAVICGVGDDGVGG